MADVKISALPAATAVAAADLIVIVQGGTTKQADGTMNITRTGELIQSAAPTYGGVKLTNAVTGTGKMVLDGTPTLATPNIGVAAGTSLVASGLLSAGTLFKLAGIETGLTAAVGGTQAGALALSATKAVHVVTTVASGADSVILPAATGSGAVHIVYNAAAANSMQLFAALLETIDAVASATGVAVAARRGRVLVDYATGVWLSVYGS